ncbi:MAG: hypothetical protein JW956_07200 [Calditrichaceae bacterium]|nr:hypothetical protein [Calditrichaceae bacterium]
MKYTLILIIILSSIQIAICASVTLPENNFLQGWFKSDYQLTFYKNDLYGHINGGAELFLEFGFDSLLVQDYSNGEARLSLEVYCMECPEAALGIYLMKCGRETPSPAIEARNSSNKYQSLIVKNNFYIQLNNFKGNAIAESAMPGMLNHLLSTIPESDPIELLNILPVENKIPGSEKIIRGQYALQPIYTFGEGDILQLNGKIFGVAADYRTDANEEYTQIVIPYPDNKKAQTVFKNLIENLDPYLKIIGKNNEKFIFEDYQKKYGQVIIQSNLLTLQIHLKSEPDM